MELNLPALQNSFDLVAPHGERLMDEFYARLFETAPAVVPLFAATDLQGQKAKLADKYSLLRSLFHTSGATHETGQQWMQTGHGFDNNAAHPHAGSVIARVFGQKSALPPSIKVDILQDRTTIAFAEMVEHEFGGFVPPSI